MKYTIWKIKHAFWKLRHWLILKLAMGEPILLNWAVSFDSIKEGRLLAYFPGTDEMWTEYTFKDKAVLVPLNSIKDEKVHKWKNENIQD